MSNKTPLYAQHVESNAKIVDFFGWELPIHYGSQIEEHHAVRQEAGMFDVSHMTIVDFEGPEIEKFLRYLLANDVAKLKDGKALYTAMLNEKAGIIDDLIVYRITQNQFRLVLNAATRDKDLAWIEKQIANFDATMTVQDELTNIAVQGPHAREKCAKALPTELQSAAIELKPFSCAHDGSWQVARTGYTGEDGFEVILPKDQAANFWNALLEAGVKPCGLGARDTLRLESGLNLYGQDMDETVTPLESNIAWTVALDPEDRDFIGRKAYEAQKAAGGFKRLRGLLLLGKGVLRAHQKVFMGDDEIGETVSGTFSPSMSQGVAFARISAKLDEEVEVDVRGRRLKAKVVKLPFVRQGKILVEVNEAA